MSKISEFQSKDVVNVSDGKMLGHIGDLEIDTTSGKIEAMVIPGNGKMMGLFGRESDVVISWQNIVRIGTDVILVRFHDMNEMNGGYNEEYGTYTDEYKDDYKTDG